MSHRAIACWVALAAALSGILALPARGIAASGGSGLAPAPGPSTNSGMVAASGGNAVVTASGGGITLSSRSTALLHGSLRITGTASSVPAGTTIEVERNGRQTHWHWTPTARATVASDGSFAALWHVNHIGRFQMRVVVGAAGLSRDAGASPTVIVIVYRPSVATIYGPGLYGNTTACGQTLGRHTLGVANRTLPCGTPVALLYRGRTIVVPVIDRGPYTNGADWDLTSATASRLGMTGTASIGAVSLPRGS